MADFSTIQSNAAVQGAYGKSKTLTEGSNTHAENLDSFGDMLRAAAAQSAENVRTGDATASEGLTGQAGLQQVVEATMTMESTVRVSVAVRDRLVEAYQEIIRMPI
jgi:flagellar hook-basal body complex protein FliE